MGRTLKRVALDFDWPLHKVWKGYINPHHPKKCLACNGSGYSPEANVFHEQWYGGAFFDPVAYGVDPVSFESPNLQRLADRNVSYSFGSPEKYPEEVHNEKLRLFGMWRCQWNHHLRQDEVDALVEEGRLMEFTHVPLTDEQVEDVRKKVEEGGNRWLPYPNGHHPTAAEVNEWSLGGAGHDCINMIICLRHRCEREGVEISCAECEGEGWVFPTEELKARHEAWEDYEPPAGEGYQLWETTSEGSPVSPVFETIEGLCEWCEEGASTFGSFKASAKKWQEMLENDFVRHEENGIVFL